MNKDRQLIFDLIDDERIKQDDKWGEQNHDPFLWCSILGEEVGEVSRAALNIKFNESFTRTQKLDHYKKELIQTAAVCIAMIECLERVER